jgi:hypothetical protein
MYITGTWLDKEEKIIIKDKKSNNARFKAMGRKERGGGDM